MRYSALAALLTALIRTYGDVVEPSMGLHFIEICAGSHRLTDSCLEFLLASSAVDARSLC